MPRLRAGCDREGDLGPVLLSETSTDLKKARRWWGWLLVLVAVAAVILVAPRAVKRYEPLDLGGRLVAPGTFVKTETDRLGVRVSVQTIDFQSGGPIRYEYSIANRGLLPITVIGLPRSRPGILIDDAISPCCKSGRTIGLPYLLWPGRTLEVKTLSHFTSCQYFGGPSINAFISQRVDYEILGVAKKLYLDLPLRLEVKLPPAGNPAAACPR